MGSHFCDLMLEKGHEVICIANLVTGDTKNIDHIKSDRFTYLKHNVTKPIYFGNKIDYIFHLAIIITLGSCSISIKFFHALWA